MLRLLALFIWALAGASYYFQFPTAYYPIPAAVLFMVGFFPLFIRRFQQVRSGEIDLPSNKGFWVIVGIPFVFGTVMMLIGQDFGWSRWEAFLFMIPGILYGLSELVISKWWPDEQPSITMAPNRDDTFD